LNQRINPADRKASSIILPTRPARLTWQRAGEGRANCVR